MEGRAHAGAGAGRESGLRFGPFELDLRAGELRKEGRRIRLQEQPFQILKLLLESPGEVVLREEIRQRLWANDTVVEFEHSINAAIKRLRDVLRDSADKPRYIETVARRGYRFIFQVDRPEPALETPTPSIAVLPFADMSGDKENEYFSDGLAEEIINTLAQMPGLKVIARTSAFAFKGKQEDIRKIAATLGVTNILEGSVRRAGSRVRIIAQLIAAADGSHLWSERFDREMADIFAVQDEIAHAIASALQVRLSPQARQYTPALPAYDAYLKGRHCMAAFTREAIARGREFFERASELDSGFSAAFGGLAAALLSSVLPGLSPAHETMPLAREIAKKALGIDPVSSEAHAVLGFIAGYYEFDWEEAQRRFAMAMASEPIPPQVRWYYAVGYPLPMGLTRECAVQCTRGLEDDPLNFIGGFHHAGGLLSAGSHDAGEALLRELCAVHPNLYQPRYLLALSQCLRGCHTEALSNAECAYTLAPWNTATTGIFAGELMHAGEDRRARELLQKLLPGDRYGSPVGLLLFHLANSEFDLAADWAEQVVKQRDPRLMFVITLLRAQPCNVLVSNAKWSAVARTVRIPLALGMTSAFQG